MIINYKEYIILFSRPGKAPFEHQEQNETFKNILTVLYLQIDKQTKNKYKKRDNIERIKYLGLVKGVSFKGMNKKFKNSEEY